MEYKREAFEMFKTLISEINRETISVIWKAIPEMQQDRAEQMQQAQKSKSRIDLERARAQQADSTNMGFRGAKKQQDQNGNQQGGSAPGEKRQPVTVEDEPGRNDYVKVQNMGTGETKELKWKYAEKMVNEDGWILVEK